MSAAVVWMTHTEAKIFRLVAGGQSPAAERIDAESRGHRHSHDPHKKHDNEHFFHELALKLEGLQEILLLGPGLAKQEFHRHLLNHHHAKLAAAIVGVESSDHPTDPQILAYARKFFKSYDAFHG